MASENLTTPKSTPAVSVIIPTYGTACYIVEALKSVFTQTFRDYEIIVINDGSPDTDELERVLAPFQDDIIYLKKANGGPGSARNLGIHQAQGCYIAMLDSDDVWAPTYLAVQIARFEADPKLAVSYTDARIFGDTLDAGRKYMDIYPSEGEVTLRNLIEQRCNVIGCSVARREVMVEAGLYDETLRTSEDFDLWMRIAARGERFGYDQRPLWYYRKHDKSSTVEPLIVWGNYLRVLRKAKRTLNLTAEEQDALDRRSAYIVAMLQFFEGKKAFFEGDTERSLQLLKQANAFLHSRKLSLVISLVHRAPHLLLRAYEARDRWIFGRSTKI